MGSVDFITTMGAGVHAHPQGTEAGASALVQACEAYTHKIPIEKFAKLPGHKELEQAIEFFGKNKSVKDAQDNERS